MTVVRVGALVAMAWLGLAGCTPGGPLRASDTQNPNAITDDISAVSMTDSETRRARDPNMHSTIPRSYETFER
jgi:hypothetical protein